MDTPVEQTVSWALRNARVIPRWSMVCLPRSSPLAAGDGCLVVDSRELEEDEDVPPAAATRGLVRTLQAEALVAVLDNLNQQLEDASESSRLSALDHYLGHDAFIEL